MTTNGPPRLPDRNSAFGTYAWAVALLLPTIFIWLFAINYILPKLEQIWQLAGLTGSKVQWLMNTCYGMKQHLHLIAGALLIILLLLECFWTEWPRYRRAVITCLTLFFHTAVLVGITTIATAIALAAPLLARHQ